MPLRTSDRLLHLLSLRMLMILKLSWVIKQHISSKISG